MPALPPVTRRLAVEGVEAGRRSQLIGLATGVADSELKFQRHVTPISKKILSAIVK